MFSQGVVMRYLNSLSVKCQKANEALSLLFLLLLVFALVVSTAPAQAQLVPQFYTDFLYMTEHETTIFNEIIWFWSRDELNGPVHSNDAIAIKSRPVFTDWFSSSAEETIQGAGYNPDFTYEPIFNLDPIVLPNSLTIYREMAIEQGYYFPADTLRQARLTADEGFWYLEFWPSGIPYDTIVVDETHEIPYDTENWRSIYIDYHLEISGTHAEGRSIIYSTDSIRLISDLYVSDTEINGLEATIPEESDQFLLLYALNKILVADTPENGRGNGASVPGNQIDHERKNILVTAQMFAPFGSFSFEDQNDLWDDYRWCDNPYNGMDERGEIFILGGIIQDRRGYIHRSNCGGTGYGKKYTYDQRWYNNPPPGMEEPFNLPGYLAGEVSWQDTTIFIEQDILLGTGTTLTIGKNATILFSGGRFLGGPGSSIIIEGTEKEPVTIQVIDDRTEELFIVSNSNQSERDFYSSVFHDSSIWKNAAIEIGYFQANQHLPYNMENVTLIAESPVYFRYEHDADIHYDKCSFYGDFIFNPPVYGLKPDLSIVRSLFEGKVHALIDISMDHCLLVSRGEQDEEQYALRANRESTITNTYFLGPYNRCVHKIDGDGFTAYCAYIDIETEPFNTDFIIECFEAPPHFVDVSKEDYRLMATSPLIDAGDPESEPDPDGSITDIGIYPYYLQEYYEYNDVSEGKDSAVPAEFKVNGPYPNPFNPSTTLSIDIPEPGMLTVDAFDILGRQVRKLYRGHKDTGSLGLHLDMRGLPGGVYFIRTQCGAFQEVTKAVLLK